MNIIQLPVQKEVALTQNYFCSTARPGKLLVYLFQIPMDVFAAKGSDMREILGPELLNVEVLRKKLGWHGITEEIDEDDGDILFNVVPDDPKGWTITLMADEDLEGVGTVCYGDTHWHPDAFHWRAILRMLRSIRRIVSGEENHLMAYVDGHYVSGWTFSDPDGLPDTLYSSSFVRAEPGETTPLRDAKNNYWRAPELRRIFFNRAPQIVSPDWSRYRPVPLGWVVREQYNDELVQMQNELLEARDKALKDLRKSFPDEEW